MGSILGAGYSPDSRVYDEFVDASGTPRPHYQELYRILNTLGSEEVWRRQQVANLLLRDQGITFAVQGDPEGLERVFPLDLIPRIIPYHEWSVLEQGVKQRVVALNLFLQDLYHEQRILRDRVVPPELIYSSPHFRREMVGLNPPGGVYVHVAGIDLLREPSGQFVVVEDNLRTPSGISYVLENRAVMITVFPELFRHCPVRYGRDYADRLLEVLQHAAPANRDEPVVVLLTPGVYNSAYFEHAFLAREMGVELVEGRDLVVRDDYVYMRTTRGLKRVDVIYRRVDDDFLDPLVFRGDSLLGAAGLFHAYLRGNVGLANAPGTGVADDKAVYSYVPAIIRYYLGEEPVLPNVETFVLSGTKERAHVFQRPEAYVFKPTNQSGGYGLVLGPAASRDELEKLREQVEENPRGWVAQPVVQMSTHPTLVDGRLVPRRVDLRPYALYGESVTVIPGGLTRVALPDGCMVVNSSQGGGSKDTWVLASPRLPTARLERVA